MGVDVGDKEVVALPPVDGEDSDTGETKVDGEAKEGGKVVSDKCVTGTLFPSHRLKIWDIV